VKIGVAWKEKNKEKKKNRKIKTEQSQGCQMAYFRTKNPYLGNFLRVLQWKMLVYFMAIWSILHIAIWFILWPFGIV
jgi:hypothetical protein